MTIHSENESPLPLPIYRIDHRHEGHFIVEVVSRITPGSLPTTSDHTWLRLYDSEGRVISFGFFGDQPIVGFWQVVRHLRPRKGRILSPDTYEPLTPLRNQLVTPIEISAEHYWKLVKWINQHQVEQGWYQVLDLVSGTNCAGFVREVLLHIGIQVGGPRLNMPSAVIRWQRQVHRWREGELRRLLKRGRPIPNELHRVSYGLP